MIRAINSADLIKFSFSGLRKRENLAHPRRRLGQKDLSLLELLPFGGWLSPGGHCWTWIEGKGLKVKGLVSARPRMGPSVWEIDALYISPDNLEHGRDLLHGLSLGAGRLGVDRIFLRLTADCPYRDAASNAGFSFYTKEYLYCLERREEVGSSVSARNGRLFPASSANEYGIFQLYNATFPMCVREVEGQILDEWRESRENRRGRRDGEEYVFLNDDQVVGWMCFSGNKENGSFDLMVRQELSDATEKLIHSTEGLLNRYPVLWCMVSEFQKPLCRALEDRGFRLVEEYETAIRYVTAKVGRPSLVPVGVK